MLQTILNRSKKTGITITDNFATTQDTISLDVVSLKSPATTFASGKGEEDAVETAMHRKGLRAQRSKTKTAGVGYVNGITTNNKSYKDAMNKAMDKFNSKKYKAAIRNFNVALVFDSNNNKALYYLSHSYYELKEYENAIQNLDKILVSLINEYYSKARFMKANILIIQKKNKEAKTLLLQIINENDEMKARAEEALKGIDN